MNSEYPMLVFYDASCPLCADEMHLLKSLDEQARFTLVDCSAKDFDERPYLKQNVDKARMMQRLHLLQADGTWVKGARAIALVYEAVGISAMAKLWRFKWLEKAYPWIADNRYLISHLGVPVIFKLFCRFLGFKKSMQTRSCENGQCNISGRKL